MPNSWFSAATVLWCPLASFLGGLLIATRSALVGADKAETRRCRVSVAGGCPCDVDSEGCFWGGREGWEKILRQNGKQQQRQSCLSRGGGILALPPLYWEGSLAAAMYELGKLFKIFPGY